MHCNVLLLNIGKEMNENCHLCKCVCDLWEVKLAENKSTGWLYPCIYIQFLSYIYIYLKVQITLQSGHASLLQKDHLSCMYKLFMHFLSPAVMLSTLEKGTAEDDELNIRRGYLQKLPHTSCLTPSYVQKWPWKSTTWMKMTACKCAHLYYIPWTKGVGMSSL